MHIFLFGDTAFRIWNQVLEVINGSFALTMYLLPSIISSDKCIVPEYLEERALLLNQPSWWAPEHTQLSGVCYIFFI
jgi:hypothetical protein